MPPSDCPCTIHSAFFVSDHVSHTCSPNGCQLTIRAKLLNKIFSCKEIQRWHHMIEPFTAEGRPIHITVHVPSDGNKAEIKNNNNNNDWCAAHKQPVRLPSPLLALAAGRTTAAAVVAPELEGDYCCHGCTTPLSREAPSKRRIAYRAPSQEEDSRGCHGCTTPSRTSHRGRRQASLLVHPGACGFILLADCSDTWGEFSLSLPPTTMASSSQICASTLKTGTAACSSSPTKAATM